MSSLSPRWPAPAKNGTTAPDVDVTGARYYPTHETEAELEFEAYRLFSSDESRQIPDSLPNLSSPAGASRDVPGSAVEGCKVRWNGEVIVEPEIRSLSELEGFLTFDRKLSTQEPPDSVAIHGHRDATLFLLFQKHSRAKLEISFEGFQMLLGHMDSFPELYEIFKAFGERRIGVEDESWAGYYSRIRTGSSASPSPPKNGDVEVSAEPSPWNMRTVGLTVSETTAPGRSNPRPDIDPINLEMCYILRHIELGEGSQPDSWTIRKTGFYQKFRTCDLQSYSLLIQPSAALLRQVPRVLQPGPIAGDYPSHWTSFPLMALHSLSIHWRAYTNFLAAKIEEIHAKFKFEDLSSSRRAAKPVSTAEIALVTFRDLQDLQTFVDAGLHAIHVLELNCDVLGMMAVDMEKLRVMEWRRNLHAARYLELADLIQLKLREQTFCKKGLQSICRRAEQISTMIGNTISLRDSSTMRELTEISGLEAAQVHALTKKTVEDTRAMKLLTFIAIIYLPASFTAAFFSMSPVFNTQDGNGGLDVQGKNLGIYLAVTMGLMGSTFFAIWAWGWIQRRKEVRRERGREGEGEGEGAGESEKVRTGRVSTWGTA